MNQQFYNEAALIGLSKTKLKKRLLDARAVLKDFYYKKFVKYTFEFNEKRLYSEDKKFALQWENNGQTTVGSCYLIEFK